MTRVTVLLITLMFLLAALAGCNRDSKPTPIARRVASPTADASPIAASPVASPVVVASPAGSPIAGLPPVDASGNWNTYRSQDNKFTIDYPLDWTVNEDLPSVFFLSTDEDALVQVTYEDVGLTLTNQQLANLASDALQQQFGPAYVEQGRQLQPDTSVRIDFFVEQDPLIDGQAFVEFRGTTLYLLMLMTPAPLVEYYYPTFERMVASYQAF